MPQINPQCPRQASTTTENLVQNVSRAGVENSGLQLGEWDRVLGNAKKKTERQTSQETHARGHPLVQSDSEWSLTTTASSWDLGGEVP